MRYSNFSNLCHERVEKSRTKTRLNTKRDKRYEKENKKSTNASVTSVVHLDWTQVAPTYLYKKVEVCMQDRNILENF